MEVTRKGEVFELSGMPPAVGEQAKNFELKDLQDNLYSMSDFIGKPTIISVIPDITTRVCELQTKRFNQEASKISEINFVTISNNTKEEQADWCGQEGIDMVMLHDPTNSFGETYGIMVPKFGHFARTVFVLDARGVIVYEQVVPEISEEPDYQAALDVAKSLI